MLKYSAPSIEFSFSYVIFSIFTSNQSIEGFGQSKKKQNVAKHDGVEPSLDENGQPLVLCKQTNKPAQTREIDCTDLH